MPIIEKKYIFNLLIFTTLFLSFSDNFRQEIGYITWIPLIVVLAISPILKSHSPTPLNYFAIIFASIVFLNSIFADDPLNTAARGAKLLFIFCFSLVITKSSSIIQIILLSIKSTLILNSTFLAFGFLGYEFFAKIGGGFRWTTLLSSPGTLYLAGALYLILITFEYSTNKKLLPNENIYQKFLFGTSSIFTILSDGGRTSVVSISLSIAFLLILQRKILLLLKIIFFIAVASMLLAHTMSTEFLSANISAERFISIFDSKNIDSLDYERSYLMKESISWISQNNPILIGKGFFTTISGENFELVVHNAYLYVWEQLGLLGLVFFTAIIAQPIYSSILHAYKFRNSQYFLTSTILFFYAVTLLFHPVATEYGPWIPYWIAMAVFSKIKPLHTQTLLH